MRGELHPEILTGSPERGIKQGCDGENELFSSFKSLSVNISKTVGEIRPKLVSIGGIREWMR